MWLLDSDLYGFVLKEQSLPFDEAPDAQAFAQATLAQQVASYPVSP